MTVSDHATIKRDLVRQCARMYARGLVAGRQGNLSSRASDGTVWMTPAGMNKGDVREADLVRLDLDGRQLEGERAPTSEYTTHLEAYRLRADVHGVAHGHPPFCTAFAAAGVPLPAGVLPEIVVELGDVPLVPYGMPSSSELTRAIAPFLPLHRGFLLANHGALALGATIAEAVDRLESLEAYAHVVHLANALGGVRVMSRIEVDQLQRLRASKGEGVGGSR